MCSFFMLYGLCSQFEILQKLKLSSMAVYFENLFSPDVLCFIKLDVFFVSLLLKVG